MNSKAESKNVFQTMLECEARYVCKLKTLEHRQRYLDGVEQKRGKASADKLRAEVINQWRGVHDKN